MKLLLDTHALLWWFTDDPRLSAPARRAIGDGDNVVLVSAASAWEIAIKHRLGKLGEARAVIPRYDELCAADGFTHLPITRAHAFMAGSISAMHRDPFDRMLAAQAHIEDAHLVSCDAAIAALGIDPLW
ncbi:PIN domain-containing protein [Chiayiivirga flava]|uniref:PIN domain nuclease of toxin-antitoxin system n=1 Tax=Chiayiivirga flava TaxID=659595 RepID=A0A7W8D823_9GAMM|nr:PIN domain nuclease of toxin-antitoxin system [Chiayiivirga flava]